MKSRSPCASVISILAAQFVALPGPAAQAQSAQAIPLSRQSDGDVAPLPNGFQAPATVLPAPLPERHPLGNGVALRIADLEAIALTNNPTIAQAAQRVAALQGKHLQVGLRPNPTIGYQGEEMGDEGAAGQQGIFVGQRFVTAGKLELNQAVVRHEIERARRDLDIQHLRVINDVRGRANDTIVAQRAVTLNKQLVVLGKQGMKTAEELRQAEEVGQADVLRARVEANFATLALNNARNEHQVAWQRLAIVMGVPKMKPTFPTDDLDEAAPEISWDEMVVRLLAVSSELARAWVRVERARCGLARAQAGRTPDVEVEAAVRCSNATESTTASVAIGVPLQIFDRNQGNIIRAHAELSAAQREVRRVELMLQDRLAVVFKGYINARQQASPYKTEILADAKSSLDLVRRGYQEGEFGYLELLTTQRTYFHVNLAYLESLHAL